MIFTIREDFIVAICLLLYLLMACILDIKHKKVSNIYIVFGIMICTLYQLFLTKHRNIIDCALGFLIPIVLLLPLLHLRALGAADIKLFSIIGGCLGLHPILPIIIASIFMGGIYSILYLLCQKSIIQSYSLQNGIHMKQRHTIYFTIPILLSVMAERGGLF